MRKLLFSFCFVISFSIAAQTKGTSVIIGNHYTINSKILNQERGLQIYLPESYHSSTQQYPVLYILDGQWFFSSGVSVQKALRVPGAIPEMIVVGITNSNPLRRSLFNEHTKFLSYLEKEVVGFIDSNFRTNKDRILFGWEDAAYFTSTAILKNNSLFMGAIVSNGGNTSLQNIVDYQSNTTRYLYIANSKKDIYNISETDAFSKALQDQKPKNLRWKYQLFNDEIHESLAHLALYKGLTFYYYNYPSLNFESIQQYVDLGGIPYLKSYFKNRAQRFGGNPSVDNATKDTLIWLAWKRDNFKYFSFFMEEFKDVLSTQRYASAYWQNRFGQFYLKHKAYTKAMKHFMTGLEKYPNSNFETPMRKGLKEVKTKL